MCVLFGAHWQFSADSCELRDNNEEMARKYGSWKSIKLYALETLGGQDFFSLLSKY